MEFLEGQTLAQRLERGALPLDEALKIAIEIADAPPVGAKTIYLPNSLSTDISPASMIPLAIAPRT
jgi:hypothetical protein